MKHEHTCERCGEIYRCDYPECEREEYVICSECDKELASDKRIRCPDCGAYGEIRGHQTCQYPS